MTTTRQPSSPQAVRSSEEFQELLELLGRVWDLRAAGAILSWDQETYMPEGGARDRADKLATLSRLGHELFTSARVGELLARLEERCHALPADSFEASLVRVTARQWRRAVRIPAQLAAELAEAASLATHHWVQARRESRFDLFAPYLARNVRLARAVADHVGWESDPYDALLDEYEPGMTVQEMEPLFAELKRGLLPLVAAIRERLERVDDRVLRGEFDEPAQERLTLEALRAMGFDFRRGRQDRSPHPFTTTFGPGDVRVTTRFNPHHLTEALFSTLHEGGHALYEQGLPEAWRRTPLFDGASLGVHESQSRLWENLVGRSREFWTFFLPRVREAFPQKLAGVDVEAIYRAVNRVQPGEIRTEADEVTYNLHIFLRFELERELLAGRLDVADLPEAWNARMEAYLGLRPTSDARGVLQDIHWAHLSIGYFPTYTLGNVLAVQFYRKALQDRPEIPECIARGDFGPLLGWLRERIHSLGASLLPRELVLRVTGSPIQAGPYLDYLRRKYGELYGF